MIGGRTLLQALGLYAAGSWLVLQVVDVLKDNMGLPDWVFPFAFVLLLIGLPIIPVSYTHLTLPTSDLV